MNPVEQKTGAIKKANMSRATSQIQKEIRNAAHW